MRLDSTFIVGLLTLKIAKVRLRFRLKLTGEHRMSKEGMAHIRTQLGR